MSLLVKFLLTFVLVGLCNSDSLNIDQVRFTKIQCEMSDNLCRKKVCNIKAFSRTVTAFSVSCDLVRKLENVSIDLELLYRPLGNFRHIAGIKHADACDVMKTSPLGSPFNVIYNYLNNATEGTIHLCPYLPGPFNVLNFTGSMRHFGKIMPKGDYKLSMKFYDDIDTEGANVALFWTLKVRTGDEF